MKIAKKITPYIFSICSATSVYAGEFTVACSYKNDNLKQCANIISDLVTDKFTSKFPSSKYSIFIHSNIHSYSSGGYAAYAITGVIPKDSGDFPIRMYNASIMNGQDRATSLELSNVELENYRDAIKQLMDMCEISSTCDIYTPKKTSKE
jgi:hypothetical protein